MVLLEDMSETDDVDWREKITNVKIPYPVLDRSDGRFTEEERAFLIRNLRSIFAFVGCSIPDSIQTRSGPIPLRTIVNTLLTKENLSPSDREAVGELIHILEQKVSFNKKAISEYNLNDEEAEKLYFEACGLMKALAVLKNRNRDAPRDVEDADRNAKMDDAKRLTELIRKIRLN